LPPTKHSELDKVVRRIHEISTLPHVALQVVEIANSPKSGASELKEAMESDPALTARVLRYVNSSAIGARDRITNLQYAIAYLGVKQIRNLAMTAAVSDLFKADEGSGCYQRSGLWRHLVSVGICTRLLGLQLSFPDFEDLFLAGLLHDIGIILEDQYVHKRFEEMMNTVSEGAPLAKFERDSLGFDHTQLGESVAEAWGFPPAVRAAIRHHHDSERYTKDFVMAVRCVDVANMICTAKGITSIGLKCVSLSPSAIQGLSLTRDDIQVLAKRLDDEIANNSALFEI
jgi:putative nucleotidyltransferase with HDIG domain